MRKLMFCDEDKCPDPREFMLASKYRRMGRPIRRKKIKRQYTVVRGVGGVWVNTNTPRYSLTKIDITVKKQRVKIRQGKEPQYRDASVRIANRVTRFRKDLYGVKA